MALEHFRTQYGVGQGSFHAAHIEYANGVGEPARFDYVYDCGGLNGGSASQASRRALVHYEPRHEAAGTVIDAMVLSHYDADHMNGAEFLAARNQVRQIYLPYLSPEQLLLEIAKCAGKANAATMDALYAGAFGGALWGADVVRVEGAVRPDEPPPEGAPDAPREPREGPGDEASLGPAPLRLVLAGTGQQVPAVLNDDLPIAVQTAYGRSIWTLKFWNFSLQGEELQLMTAALLESIGFPVSALEESGSANQVLGWLGVKANRAAAVEAYRIAVGEYSKTYPPVANMANLCSLALFSGPARPVGLGAEYWANPNVYTPMWYPDERHGWLGTGDALLGEAQVWADFSAHYYHELPQVRTVLIPHHGAAPNSGPSFYNEGLNERPATITAISAGAQNNYGHPRGSVVQKILRKHGCLHIITEHSWPGLLEHLVLE